MQKAQSDLERDEMISSLKEKFSRGQDDAELDSRLRAAQHWDDPMRHLLGQVLCPPFPLQKRSPAPAHLRGLLAGGYRTGGGGLTVWLPWRGGRKSLYRTLMK